jgi:ABC-type phosphonate transport system ATPase subunit
VSPSDAKSALQAVQTDLKMIQDQLPDLKGSMKQQLQSANTTFKAQVQTIAGSITGAQSLSAAASALATAGQKLASSYQQAFANVSC